MRLDDVLNSSFFERAMRYTEHECVGLERTSPIFSMLAHIGNYWRSGILLTLRLGSVRPSMIQNIINARPQSPISRRMLSINLRALERDGLVERVVYESGRAHVEYRLTELGQMLSDLMVDISEWGTRHVKQIVAAREEFDLRHDRHWP